MQPDRQEVSGALQAMRASRSFRLAVGAATLHVRRPTVSEALSLQDAFTDSAQYRSLAQRFVVGWEGVTLRLLTNDESMPEDEVPFDVEVLDEWFADRVDVYTLVVSEVLDKFYAYRQALGAVGKT